MSNRRTRGLFLLAGLSAAAAATLVYACGPFFPMQLLDNRERTLLGAPSNSFAYEAAHLVQVEPGDPIKPPAESKGSAPAAASPALQAAEQSADAAAQAVADCEPGDGCAHAVAASHAAYAHVRDLVMQGTPDPAGLAAASFGDEALLYLRSEDGPFELELTVNKGRAEPYDLGNAYGHLAVAVDDLAAEHKRLVAAGLKPTDLKAMQHEGKPFAQFFFLTDPDGYRIEVLQSEGRFQ